MSDLENYLHEALEETGEEFRTLEIRMGLASEGVSAKAAEINNVLHLLEYDGILSMKEKDDSKDHRWMKTEKYESELVDNVLDTYFSEDYF